MKKLWLSLLTAGLLTMASTAAWAANANGDIPADVYYPGSSGYTAPLASTDVDNNIGNVNRTGEGVTTNDGSTVDKVIKSDNMRMNNGTTAGTQRTHGEYQNNTNACASCHQTHTAAAKNLLFKDGVYNTCTACHDGTLGFYNVFEPSSAGTFGGTIAGNASVHLATGVMQIKAAPGGNKNATSGSWISQFNCASCHAPHGSYSDRLLHYNPNNMANETPDKGGQKLVGLTVVDTLPTADASAPAYVLYRTTAGTAGITGENADEKVVVLMKKSGNQYVRDLTPWLYGYNRQGGVNYYYSVLRDSTGQQITANVEYEYGKAYVKGAGVDVAVTGDICPVYVVKLSKPGFDKIPVKDFGGVMIYRINEGVYDEPQIGAQISKFCAACHTDYLAGSGSATGIWSQAFRHTTTSDNFSCLKCHYAHGTDVTVMKDAKDQTVQSLVASGWTYADAVAYLLDQNPSSALKRYTNMAVCWKCHTESKASQLKNNDYYWNNPDAPHGPNNW